MSDFPADAKAVGRFVIEREAGRGAMGIVYLAHDTRLGRQVALKALPEHLSSDAARLQRLEREAQVPAPQAGLLAFGSGRSIDTRPW